MGLFVLSEFKVFRPDETQSSGLKPIPLHSAFATFEERPAQHSLEPGESGWSIFGGGEGRSQIAYFALGRDAEIPASIPCWSCSTSLTEPVTGNPRPWGVSGCRCRTTRPRSRRNSGATAARKVADPWLRLAAAYALIGHNDEALRYLSRALEARRRLRGEEADR